ncbi:MAG: protein-(glutamine-N5) methyltransferase, release factor-specific [Gemmatimonadetes bacterium]|nr:protein-(glutamine-N5) methyltransferase, release factor-specific [Gemmatimonadota bacterium]
MSVAQVIVAMTGIIGDRTEARDLLALMQGRPRHWPAISASELLTRHESDAAERAAKKRASGAPLEYAAGKAAFRHLTLNVDERVLIPRPETEVLVDIVLDLTRDTSGGIAVDVGTGSGAIALALASEGRFESVIATDISLDALHVARANAVQLGIPVDFRHGSLLTPVTERNVRAIVSNPPYIAHDEADALPVAVRDWEPSVALFSGAGGMATTSELIRASAAVLASGGILALEVDVRRAAVVVEHLASHGAYESVRVLLDLTGRERFVAARLRETSA